MKKVMLLIALFMFSVVLIAQDGEAPVRDWSWIWQAITGGLVLIGGFFKVASEKWKGKAKQLAVFGGDVVDVLEAGTDLADTAIDAAADNVFTDVEKAAIKEGANKWKNEKAQVVASWKVLIGKELPS